MIPFEELALQTTLLYSPPEPAAAEALLAGIAAAEHEAVSGQYLRSLVENCQLHRMDSIVFHKPLPPPTDRWPLGVDLRAALCQLQLEVGGSPHLSHSLRKEAKCARRVKPPPMREGGPEGDLGEMKEVARMTDVISSVDAGIARRPRAIIEVSSWKRSCGRHRSFTCLQLCDPDHYKPSEDDQIGFHAMLKPLPRLESQILPMLSHENEMASAAMDLAVDAACRVGWVDDSLVENLGIARYAFTLRRTPHTEASSPDKSTKRQSSNSSTP